MPISRELSRLPGIAYSFYKAGLLSDLMRGMIKGEMNRNIVEDARKLLKELSMETKVDIWGLENIPKEGGSLIVFNHPNNDILLPAMLEFIVRINDLNDQRVKIAMVSELTLMSESLNEKTALPGSVQVMERFNRMYTENIISVPTAKNRKDYLTGRIAAVRKLMRAVRERQIVIISPEGHVEKDGKISPLDSYHDGAGKLAMLATKMESPTVPMALWKEGKTVQVVVGKPFFITAGEGNLATIEAMYEVAKYLPEELRGPFR